MVWSLEIHHIDVVGSGDATLIVARNNGGGGHVAQMRTALVDGGRLAYADDLDLYLTTQVAGLGIAAPAQPLDVMVVTHYDRDHVEGIYKLLRLPPAGGAVATIYDNVRVYDQGEPSAVLADEMPYVHYVEAIASRGARTRVTRNVASDQQPVNKTRRGVFVLAGPVAGVRTAPVMFGGGAVPNNPAIVPPALAGAPVLAAGATTGWWHPYWLVGREILWADAAGEPVPPAGAGGAPTLTCIAANRYVRNGAGTSTYRATGIGIGSRVNNEKSLAFELRFGNFRYYIGGDIETHQETTIAEYLNQADSVAGRVHVVKASHHGANTATSRAFVDRMRPEAVMISCGQNNQYRHPDAQTTGVLDGFPGAPPPPPPPPAPTFRPVWHYLTGYQTTPPPPAAPISGGGARSRTASVPAAATGGDVVVHVAAVQAGSDPSGLLANALTATVNATAGATGVPIGAALLANATNRIIAAGTVDGAVTGTITSLLTDLGQAGAAAAVTAAATPAAVGGGIAGGLIPVIHGAATGAGVPAAQAAVVAAAAGLLADAYVVAPGGVPGVAALATQTAAAGAAIAPGPAGAAGAAAQNAVIAAVHPTGLFRVTYDDLVGPQQIPHY